MALRIQAVAGPAPGAVLTIHHGPFILEVTCWPDGTRDTKLATRLIPSQNPSPAITPQGAP